MKHTLAFVMLPFLPLLLYGHGIFRGDNDTLLEYQPERYSMVDHLDSVLQSWFYDVGQVKEAMPLDTTVSVEVADSVFAERLNDIITPINLTYNDIVQQYLDKYVKRGKYSAPKFLGMSHQYFPLFEEKLDAYDIPLELKYLPVIESALNPKAKSRMGAAGLWQFMFNTGKMMGLEINTYVDERMDPVKSTEAACRYLKSLYETYNNWTLALAAYNCGPAVINRALRRAGDTATFWDIYPMLPYETKNYIPAYTSIVYLFTYYKQHGYTPEEIEFYDDVDTVFINHELHFAQLDSVLGIEVEQSRMLNPQYKRDIVPAKNKSYPLRMRRQYISRFIELEDSIYAFRDTLFFGLEKFDPKVLTIASDDDYIPLASQPQGTTALEYVVKSGDVVGLIADWYDVKSASLRAWNGISRNKIKVGQKLKIYVPNAVADKYRKINKMTYEQKQKSIGKEVHKEPEKLDPTYEYYTVKRGDSPYGISLKYEGVTAEDIMRLNNTTAKGLKIGQKLKIRKKQ